MPRRYPVALHHIHVQAYFQQGRVGMTYVGGLDDDSKIALVSNADVTAATAVVYPMRSIWVTPDAVRKAPRVYH